MQQIDNILYFTYSELVPIVLTKSNFDQLKNRGNIVVSGRGGNGREVLIEANSLPFKYKELAKVLICGGLELGEFWLKSQIVNWLPPIPAKDKQAIEEFRITRETIDFETGSVEDKVRHGLPPEAKTLYLKQVRWIILIIHGWEWHKSKIKALDINSKEQFRQICISLANSPKEGAKLGKNMTALRRDKLNPYEKQGVVGIISERWGNVTSRKIGDEQLQNIIDLYGDATKPSAEAVTDLFNKIAVAKGWKTVTSSCLKLNLKRPEVMQVWYLARHGVKAWKNKFEFKILRFKPTLPNALWVGDDTKVNLKYMELVRNKNGKDVFMARTKLNVYAIVDAMSGYWLGWSYAENKDGKDVNVSTVRDAYANAVKRSGGIMPYQMQYDNDKANLFYKRLNTLNFPCMPNNGQSKIIERCFLALQSQFMKRDTAFTGQNVTATHIDNRLNEEAQTMYNNKEEAMHAQDMWFEIMNNTPGKDGKTPKEKYFSKENSECTKLTQLDEMDLFWEWNEKPITYKGQGIEMIHEKRKLNYLVTENNKVDESFLAEHVHELFKVKYNPKDLTKIALYTEDERFVSMATEVRRIAMAVQDYRPDERKVIDELLKAKKTQQFTAKKKRKASADFSSAEDIIKMGPNRTPKHIYNQAEADIHDDEIIVKYNKDIEYEEPLDIEKEQRARLHRKDRYNS